MTAVKLEFSQRKTHLSLVGRIAKLHSMAVEIERGYQSTLGFGDPERVERAFCYNHCGGRYQTSFMFIDEPPFRKYGVDFYCLQEIGCGVNGDWVWYSLEQLIICN